MNRKRIIFFFMASVLLAGLDAAESPAHKEGWLTSLPPALEQAKKENKSVLLYFTGSDWCPPCKALDKNVFAESRFKEYAAKNLVSVELDFPLRAKLPKKQKKANERLQEKYRVIYFPTLILLNSEGKELGRDDGYAGNDVEWFINKMESFKSKP